MKSLTDVDEFTSPIDVCEGFDSHNTLAEFIESIAQRLANRTRHLKDRLDPIVNPALRGAPNTFTEPQIIDVTDPGASSVLALNTDQADAPLFGTDQTPSDHPDAVAGGGPNKWKYIGSLKRAGGQYVYLLTGGDATEGCFAIVTNAQWNVDDQLWNLRDPLEPGGALILFYDTLRFAVRAAGTSPWAEWDMSTYDGKFEIATISAFLVGAASFAAGPGGYQYDPPQAQTTALPLGDGVPNREPASGNFAWNRDNNGEWSSVLANGVIWFPIRLPSGAELQRIDVLHATLGSANVLHFVKREPNWAGQDAATITATAFAGPNTPAPFSIEQCSITETISEANEYGIRINAPTVGAAIMNIRLVWIDPGPRNH